MEKTVREIFKDTSIDTAKKMVSIYGEDVPEEIEEMKDGVETKENKVKSKVVKLDDDIRFIFELSPVQSENDGEIQFKNFSFKDVFGGMTAEFEAIEQKWSKFKQTESHKYSNDYVMDYRQDLFLQVYDLRQKYKNKFQDEMKALKNPTKTQQVMGYSDEQVNEVKRNNNILLTKHFLETCTMHQIRDYYDQNKHVYDVMVMILTHCDKLSRTSSEGLSLKGMDRMRFEEDKRIAEKLKHEINYEIAQRANPEYYEELQKIEFNTNFILNKDEFFPCGLENGMTSVNYKKILQ